MKLGQVIAHRGLTGQFAPNGEMPGEENTLTAFRHAIELGVDGIELDVQMTRDGNLVVIHDEDLGRTTTGTGEVRQYTLKELQQFDIKRADGTVIKGEKIPLYGKVLELLHGTKAREKHVPTLNTEFKTDYYPYIGIEQRCLKLVSDWGLLDHLYYSSFNHKSLEIIHLLRDRTGQNMPTALLFYDDQYPTFPQDLPTTTKQRGATAFHPHVKSLLDTQTGQIKKPLIQQLQKQGYTVRCYTVNDSKIAEPLLRLGVDVITNRPDRMLQLKQSMASSP